MAPQALTGTAGRGGVGRRAVGVVLAVVVGVGACSASDVTSGIASPRASPASSADDARSLCEAAVRAAAVPNDMQEVTSLDRAIRACPTLAELERAATAYPTALKGVSAASIVTYRCRVEPTLASAPICQALPK